MNWIGAVEGGLTGTAALKVLQETLHKIDKNSPRPFLHTPGGNGKAKSKKGKNRLSAQPWKQGGELLSSVLFFGVPALADKSKAPLVGGLMGAAAGLWNAFVVKEKRKGAQKKKARKRFYKLFLYTTAGVLAGEAIKHLPAKAKKQPSAKKDKEVVKLASAVQQPETRLLSTILYIDEVPVGYEIQKDEHKLSFSPSQYSAKECCPPRFAVIRDGDSWLFEPATLVPDLQNQVIHELRTMEAGKLLE